MIFDCIAMSARSVAVSDLMQVCGWVIAVNTLSMKPLAITTSGHRLFGSKNIIFAENVSLSRSLSLWRYLVSSGCKL